MKRNLWIILIIFAASSQLWARPMVGRLGVGTHNQFQAGLAALSLKFQKSPTLAFGASLGARIQDENTRMAGAFKVYRIIFDEPQLNFYVAAMFAVGSKSVGGESGTILQGDGTFGCEFHFAGLSSVGLSFEFGFSASKEGDSKLLMRLFGDNIITAGIHFYL